MKIYNHSNFNMTNTDVSEETDSKETTTPSPNNYSNRPIFKLSVNPDEYTTDVTTIHEVLPIMIDENKPYSMMENTEFKQMISYGAQITPMEFWSNDKHLKL